MGREWRWIGWDVISGREKLKLACSVVSVKWG